MRCPNCGWMGSESHLQCEKCKSPLNGNAAPSPSGRPQSPQQGVPHNATVIGKRSSMPAWDGGGAPVPGKPTDIMAPEEKVRHPRQAPPIQTPKPTTEEKSIVCAGCGYSNPLSAKFCVSCGASFKSKVAESAENPTPAEKVRDSNKDSQEPVKRQQLVPQNVSVNATVNPWSNKKTNGFVLKVIPREGERVEAELHFDGNSVELNRSVLEPSNNSITNKIQAQVEFYNGSWYISNKSAQQTTFIRVSGQTELHKGDVILLGDRLFEFDC